MYTIKLSLKYNYPCNMSCKPPTHPTWVYRSMYTIKLSLKYNYPCRMSCKPHTLPAITRVVSNSMAVFSCFCCICWRTERCSSHSDSHWIYVQVKPRTFKEHIYIYYTLHPYLTWTAEAWLLTCSYGQSKIGKIIGTFRLIHACLTIPVFVVNLLYDVLLGIELFEEV